VKNYVLVQGQAYPHSRGWHPLVCPQTSIEDIQSQSIFFNFFQKKNKKLRKIMYWFRAGLPTLQGVTSSGVSPDKHWSNIHSQSIFYCFQKEKIKKN